MSDAGSQRNGVSVKHVPFIRDTSTQILFAYIPRVFCEMTPYIVLQIKGATGHLFQSYLFPSERGACNPHWLTFCPGSESLGYITPLALPWTITILAADGSPMALGEDGQTLEYDEEYGMLRNQHECTWRKGDVLWAYVRNELRRTQVLEVNSHYLRIEGIKESCKVLDYSKQWNIIFEISTSKSKS
jgi:hypothetical protein